MSRAPRLLVPRLLVPRLLVPRLLVPRLLVPRLLVPRLLVPLLLLASGCTSHLETARLRWAEAAAARATGGAPAARPAAQAALAAAQASRAAGEEREGQAALLEASARAVLEDGLSEARLAALRAAREAGVPAQRAALRAATCQAGADGGWQHFAALCWQGLLDQPGPLRAVAAEGYANAISRRLPDTASLRASLELPLLKTLIEAVLADPLEADLLAVLAQRLDEGCDFESFTDALPGWRQLQFDLADAAIALDGFRDHDQRCSLRALRARLARQPLCGRAAEAPHPAPALPPDVPRCGEAP